MRALLLFATAVLGVSIFAGAIEARAADEIIATEKAKIRVAAFAKGLEHPWGLAFLPDGRALVTEREGRLRIVSKAGKLSAPLNGVPKVDAREQGGLLDVAVDPDFADNKLVYLSYAEPGTGGTNSTAVARGALTETGLTGIKVIFSQQPKVKSSLHFGSRLVFDGKGHLFITLGERFKKEYRGQAQDLSSDLGKVVRIGTDGSIPKDNPFVGQKDARPEIWSYGHRNQQGAAINPASGELWNSEHGPRGGDEINIVRAGKNYGWPLVSYGINYDGTPVGEGKKTGPGITDPVYTWVPSIGTAGMTFYTSDAIGPWRGDLFVGGMAIPKLVRLELDGDKITHEEALLADMGSRIRDVVQGPDGALYLLTDDGEDKILRVSAAE
ncbi:MAG: PQQ-dependent sugar dehydrogenase [Parvibaculum sp.]|uniref:PQQ-dependent sugar dehydrogenase n=1 Tax=Parvibaculum sp. TaxID=2024848 RepID=UPI0025E882B5|nr:PQQ-dependent sugar dehydrogenase [Parvibaculum sp.]MCE9648293.1 PQQ-dependent sugar dehydrogenase [Parvibaculum sp.]